MNILKGGLEVRVVHYMYVCHDHTDNASIPDSVIHLIYPGYLLKAQGLYAISYIHTIGSTHYYWGGPFSHWNYCYHCYLASVQVSLSSNLDLFVFLLNVYLARLSPFNKM